ncbi:MAG: D-alanyl-D-alanine carboxypeptidase/D-alanyl-D-alanine-endopeptidase, partial [Armatimonadota bacterium]
MPIPVPPQPIPYSVPLARTAVWRDAIDAALADPALAAATTGVVVRHATTGAVLYRRNGGSALIPASNQKLATAAAALALLGPDHRHTTRIVRSGRDLWLIGDGDPSLDTEALNRLANDCAAALATGDTFIVHADETAFEPDHLGAAWQWDDIAYDYSAPFGALVRDRSTAEVRVVPGAPGGPAHIAFPQGAGGFQGTVTTVPGTAAHVEIRRDPGSSSLIVAGTIGADAPPWSDRVAVADAARWAIHGLIDALVARGIAVVEGPRCAAPSGALEIATVRSAPLSTRLRDFLVPSDNLAGECLIRTLGRRPGGPGSARS